MVGRPPATSVLLGRQRRLPADEKPATRHVASQLVTREQIRESREERLQDILSVVGRLDHRYEVVIASQQEDAAAHSAESRRLCRQQAPPRTAAFGRPRIGDGYKKGYKIGLAASGKKTKGPRLRALLK